MVFVMLLMLAFLVATIPSAVLVALALLVQHFAGLPWTAWMFPVWGLLAAGPLVVGASFVVLAGARLWDNLDPSEEVLEIGR